MKLRAISSVLAAAVLGLGLTACGSDDAGDAGTDSGGGAETEASGPELIAEGSLTVCSDVPYPPFEDFDTGSPSGFTGFDIDIVSAIAEGLEVELVVRDSGFESLQSGQALNAGQCDLAASAMTITEEREANLDFSDGYYDSEQSLLVAEGSDIASIEDLDGMQVGVQQGTTGKAYTEENAANAEIVSFPSDAEMYTAIKAGQVDALLQDLPVNLDHANDGGFEVVETYPTDEQYGFVIKKGNTALVDAVNEQLTVMRDDGSYDEIYNTYFSTD